MSILIQLGQIMVAAFYLMNGYNHLTQADAMAGYAASKGIPSAKLAVQGTGVLMIVAGLLILIGYWIWLAVLLLVLFYIPVTYMMHNFWTIKDPMQRQNDMIHFMKNLALLGSALMYLAV